MAPDINFVLAIESRVVYNHRSARWFVVVVDGCDCDEGRRDEGSSRSHWRRNGCIVCCLDGWVVV
jgi:hypothetical protein